MPLDGNSIVPGKELRCILMDAGVVDFKLCDRNLECDDCPFYREIRASMTLRSDGAEQRVAPPAGAQKSSSLRPEFSAREAEEYAETLLRKKVSLEFPNHLSYAECHLWSEPCGEGMFRIGIDACAASLLEGAVSYIEPQSGSNVRRGTPFAWLVLPDGAIALHSPLHGKIVATNPLLRTSPRTMLASPYGDGWIAKVASSEAEPKSARADATAIRETTLRQLDRLAKHVRFAAKKAPHVGITLYDGGYPVATLPELLGGKAYVALVQSFLSPE